MVLMTTQTFSTSALIDWVVRGRHPHHWRRFAGDTCDLAFYATNRARRTARDAAGLFPTRHNGSRGGRRRLVAKSAV